MRLNASPAWRYFSKLSQSEAQCLRCEAIFPLKKGCTSHLLAHIKLRHSEDNLGDDPDIETEPMDPIIIPTSRESQCVLHSSWREHPQISR